MPSAKAQSLTRQFQLQVLRIAELIARRLRVTAMRADVADIDGWWERISPQVQREILTGQTALARMARQYLVQHAALEGATVEPVVVEPVAEQISTALLVTGPVAFKTHMRDSGSEVASVRTMASQLQGSATRLVLAGARDTTMATVQQRPGIVGYRRIRGRPEPCPFCLMLISRGAVYSRETADFHAHDRCSCMPEPLYRHEPEPPEVRALYRQWREATAGTTGPGSIRAWRAHLAKQAAPDAAT
ncbi:hypothetical protein ABZ135_18470 [Streptomyces sp. NPDC006339]|uniref:VG15 protein n=1 Tax=Streptomyces sp. NPDC006339 TaxID=3156755 RepID=UPI0033A516BF